jgi:hypothetical protein
MADEEEFEVVVEGEEKTPDVEVQEDEAHDDGAPADQEAPPEGMELDPDKPGYYRKVRERETPEQTNERRRKERDLKKQRRQEAQRLIEQENIQLKQQLASVQERVARVENRTQSADFARIDAAINNAGAELQHAQKQMKDAIAIGDGETAVAAQTRAYEAQRAIEQLNAFKQQAEREVKQPRQPALDPVIKNYGEAWMRANPWYKPQANDEESAIVLAIDQRLTQEGWDPRKKDYWDELDRRVARRLPEVAGRRDHDDDGDDEPVRPKKSPVSGSGRDSGGTSKNVIRISPERKKVLQEMGVWDDPKKRLEYVKYFQKYDAENKNA